MSEDGQQGQRLVVVTGGSRGLGLGIATDLLDAGYAVATCSRTSTDEVAALQEAHGPNRLMWAPCTIGDPASETEFMAAAAAFAADRQLWGLVNNAAVAKDGILATFPDVESERIINVNLLGSLRLCRLFLRPLLRSRKGGRIVNISSIIGSRGYTGLAAYSASKAGLDGLTRAWSREVGRRQITVNSVAPGYLVTDMSATLQQQAREQIVRRTPMHRLGAVEDITPAVRFLLSDGARFITGQTLIIDGGITT